MGNTLVDTNAVLARSSALRQYGTEAVGLIVDGLPAKNRSAEISVSTQPGVFPSWAWVIVVLLLFGVLLMGAITYSSMKVGKRGSLIYTRNASVAEDSDSDQEVEPSSSDADKL